MDRESLLIMDQEGETREEGQTRLGLWYAIRDCYAQETYLGRRKIAAIIIDALSREQASELADDINKSLNA